MRRAAPRPGFEREVVASFRGKIKPRPRLPGQEPERKPWPWPEGHERHGTMPGSVTRQAPLPLEQEDESGPTRLVRWRRGR